VTTGNAGGARPGAPIARAEFNLSRARFFMKTVKTFRKSLVFALGVTAFLATVAADAHVSFLTGGALPFAGKSWVGTLNLPHGCEAGGNNYDTERVEVEIPAAFTGVRPAHSTFGKASVTAAGGVVSKLTWTQAPADVQSADTHFYQVTFRGTLPATAFTTLQFRTVQFCDNDAASIAWEGADVPKLRVLPARTPGWNKYTIPAGVSLTTADVKAFFADALVVWFGNKAYSPNAETTAQIGRKAGVTSLVTATGTDVVLNAGDEIWVRY
jgi:uncharacterized protein YcnI